MDQFQNMEDTQNWDFAGWGKAEKIENLPISDKDTSVDNDKHKNSLTTWKATAICGNDISSSCLYVSALCAAQAGVLAPLILLGVSAVLFLFRKIYAEVGSALPLNGGTYTLLLNTTNKKFAAAAACLTILSYMATAVISATEAMHYAHHIFDWIPVISATVGLLSLFAFLVILGISESAIVALGIFIFHLITLTILCVAASIAIAKDPSMLSYNFSLPSERGLAKALFFGFAAAMLGISGFESSANFIEEQKKGVFPKTLRNMWVVVSVFNPLISFLSLGLLSLTTIKTTAQSNLLSQMGTVAWGPSLGTLISIDAVLVLSGAVLTSYVGVIGLVKRMSLDRCLPQILLSENKARKTNHWIVLSFLFICVSVLYVTGGDILILAGVYSLSFLSVMALFAIGNMMLKTKRGQLPRDVKASWVMVGIALVAVLIAIAGKVLEDPENMRVFSLYYFVALVLVAVMFLRIQILRVVLHISRSIVEKVVGLTSRIDHSVIRVIERINKASVVYFTRGDSPVTLNNAVLYVTQNESTNRMIVVHVYDDEATIPKNLAKDLKTIDQLYPGLRIDFLAVKGSFGPGLIDALSKRLAVPRNYMFIGTPGDRFPHRVEELGGVRIIL